MMELSYSTKIFLPILETSISTYQLDQNILVYPQHFNFYVSTRPKYSCASIKYSCASLTLPFLRIYSTKNSCASHDHFYVSTNVFLRISDTSISTYLLDQIFLRIYKIFLRISDTSISTYLLDQDIPAHL